MVPTGRKFCAACAFSNKARYPDAGAVTGPAFVEAVEFTVDVVTVFAIAGVIDFDTPVDLFVCLAFAAFGNFTGVV